MPSNDNISRRSFFLQLLKKGGVAIGGYLSLRLGFNLDEAQDSSRKISESSADKGVNISGENNSIVLPVKEGGDS